MKLIPITIGRPEPIFQRGKSCIKVPIPAISIALCSLDKPQAPATINIGAIFATNIAKMCCKPNGIACLTGILPSRQ